MMYKKLGISNEVYLYGEAIVKELEDRFKAPPESVVNLMRISLVRNMARDLGLTDIKQKGENPNP